MLFKNYEIIRDYCPYKPMDAKSFAHFNRLLVYSF